jgi:hypothetical protein
MLAQPVDLVELSKKFLNKWVAIDPENGDVLAAAESVREVLAATNSEMPLVLKVRRT